MHESISYLQEWQYRWTILTMLKSCKMWYCILLAMMVTKGFYLQLCKQKYLIAIMHKKVIICYVCIQKLSHLWCNFAIFLTDLNMLCESLVLSSHKLVSNKFFRIFLTSVWHVSQRSYTCFFLQISNMFCTILKLLFNNSQTCF